MSKNQSTKPATAPPNPISMYVHKLSKKTQARHAPPLNQYRNRWALENMINNAIKSDSDNREFRTRRMNYRSAAYRMPKTHKTKPPAAPTKLTFTYLQKLLKKNCKILVPSSNQYPPNSQMNT
jgi:hypothetical protein